MATVKTADKVKRKEVFLITHTQHFWSSHRNINLSLYLRYTLISPTLLSAYHSNLIIFKEMYSYGTSQNM